MIAVRLFDVLLVAVLVAFMSGVAVISLGPLARRPGRRRSGLGLLEPSVGWLARLPRIAAGSRYAVYGRLDVAPLDGDPREREVCRFTQGLLVTAGESLPGAVTVDVGLTRDPDTGHERWTVVEANMPWFSHGYAARADTVLDVVLRAAGPRGQVSPCDAPFLRESAASGHI
ncbi:hypothetical protein [Streptomyces shenzhenensis]|uniref:hypothetical protein n=1 Tax=Streptomyces shenzhenensis TaxID=943815 RepID=UPI002867CDBB|nr:hypothetical protein [Streptomyces shenzhenensis]